MRHLLNPLDFSVEEISQLLDLANDIEKNPQKYAHVCDGKKLATLFYEPSTRTRLSFESAMLRAGRQRAGILLRRLQLCCEGRERFRYNPCYLLLCRYLRHAPSERGGAYGSLHCTPRIPVINAGDGGHQHPTQTLTDLLTIRSLKGRLDQPDCRTVRGSEIRPYGSLPDQRSGAVFRYPLCPHLSAGASDSRTISGRMFWRQRELNLKRWKIWMTPCRSLTSST